MRMTSVSSRCTWTKTHTACMSPFQAVSSAFPWVAVKGILPATSKRRANAHVAGGGGVKMYFVRAGHRFDFIVLLFSKCHKRNDNSLCLVVNVQSVTNDCEVHFPEKFNPVVWCCVCLCGKQVLHCIKGSLLWLEASRSLWEDTAWCFVSSSLSCNIKCKYKRWDNKIFCATLLLIFTYIFVALFLGLNMSRTLN